MRVEFKPPPQMLTEGPAWSRTPLTFRLDGGSLSSIVDVSLVPSVLDVVLEGSCLTAILPSYRTTPSWPIWGGRLPFFTLIGMAAYVEGFEGLPPSGDHEPSLADNFIVVLKWCTPEFAASPSLVVTFTLGPLQQTVTVKREAGPPAALAACTFFNDVTRFLTWARYMHALGFDVVHGYYNGNIRDFLTTSPSLASEFEQLLQAGRLSLTAWPFEYRFWSKTQSTQFGAMSSCMARTASTAWRAFFDDDEYIFLPRGTTITQYLSGNRSKLCVLLKSRWAAAKVPCPATDSPAGGACWGDLAGKNLSDIAAADIWQAHDFVHGRGDRTKYFLQGSAPPVYSIHYVPACEDPQTDGAGFFHIVRQGGAHTSLSGQALEAGFPRAQWVPAAGVLAEMLPDI